jgi:hypothetical protein
MCRTIVGRARTYAAISIDSIGYEEYYRTLFHLLDLDYDEGVMRSHHQALDNKKKWRKEYSKQPHVRQREAKVRALRIRENIRKEYADKKAGKSYSSGCNDPFEKAKEEKKMGETKEEKLPCGHCGKKGHSTTRSRYCTFTTYSPKLKKGKFVCDMSKSISNVRWHIQTPSTQFCVRTYL